MGVAGLDVENRAKDRDIESESSDSDDDEPIGLANLHGFRAESLPRLQDQDLAIVDLFTCFLCNDLIYRRYTVYTV